MLKSNKIHGDDYAVDRQPSAAEKQFIRDLLEDGKPEAYRFIPQIDEVRVVSECRCNCGRINFVENRAGGILVLSKYWSFDSGEGQVVPFVFAVGEKLGGLDMLIANEFGGFGDAPHASIAALIDARQKR